MSITTYPIEYVFEFGNKDIKRYRIHLDAKSALFVRSSNAHRPEWTRLEYQQCETCQLDHTQHVCCPVAVNISELIIAFKDISSISTCKVTCVVPERTCTKNTTVQRGLASILGIVMATSACPSMDILRPLARFHVPFASTMDTLVRTTSMYLLRQYFMQQKGGSSPPDLSSLDKLISNIHLVNSGIINRINAHVEQDANHNAIIILNSVAQILSCNLSSDLSSIEQFFSPLPG